jgi:hypothetical protein
MEVNITKNELNEQETQGTLNHEETPGPKDNNIPKGLPKKVTIPLPRTQKGIKILINALKTLNPAATL